MTRNVVSDMSEVLLLSNTTTPADVVRILLCASGHVWCVILLLQTDLLFYRRNSASLIKLLTAATEFLFRGFKFV